MRRRAAITLGVLGAGLLAGSTAFAQTVLEQQVKAAFLSKFAAFVTWPPGAFAAPSAPLYLCVVGHDPFGTMLDASVQGQTVDGRTIVVRRIPTLASSAGCHVAFLGRVEGGPGAARPGNRSGVLTVADGVVDGAAIQFVIRANRVRFRIDQRAAAAAGLQVSSKLLNLAVEVDR